MTDTDPEWADVLIVGASSAKSFLVSNVGDHDNFIDALWNRDGKTCRAMYDAATTRPSKTRPNLDRLSAMLASHGLNSLQTNVTCTSARYDSEVIEADRILGTQLFKAVVQLVPWRAMIVYGVGASKRFARAFDVTVPPVPALPSRPVCTIFLGRPVFVSPTLAPPSYRTSVWSYLEDVVIEIANRLSAYPTNDPQARSRVRMQSPKQVQSQEKTTDETARPEAFRRSAANELVWKKIKAIADASSNASQLTFKCSSTQASLHDGKKLLGTTRIFRHKFTAEKPDILVREDIFHRDPTLRAAAKWAKHKTPVFWRVSTDDPLLLERILAAVEKSAAPSSK